ncbi:glutamate--tRNA ligase family protein [Actinomycetes bacterium KLBMP 9797]
MRSKSRGKPEDAQPTERGSTVVDLVRGKPIVDNAFTEDFVSARADGSLVFLAGQVVDDIAMGIAHVVRAEDHLSNPQNKQL